MTRRLVSVLCLLALPALASAAPKRSLTLEDIFAPDADWDGVSLQSLQWEADGSAFLYVDADPDGKTKNIYRENVDDGERTVVVDGKSLVLGPGRAPIPFTDYQASEDGLFFVLAGPRSQVGLSRLPAPRPELLPLRHCDSRPQAVVRHRRRSAVRQAGARRHQDRFSSGAATSSWSTGRQAPRPSSPSTGTMTS